MSGNQSKLRIESLLAEADFAERAGVFRTTPEQSALDALTRRIEAPRGIRLYRWISGAAAIAALLGAAAVLRFAPWNSTPRIEEPSPAKPVLLAAYRGFDRCIEGPSGVASGDCARFDVDRDQRVSLADFAGIQRSAAGTH
ncbi:MAG: hypothetical protein J5J06_17155 [Phycisphaerae bacterium]|nr:hypothetical protein [Phycisphaerae bacterium]